MEPAIPFLEQVFRFWDAVRRGRMLSRPWSDLEGCAGAVALRRRSRQRLLATTDTLKRAEFMELADDAALLCRTASAL